MIRTGGPVSDAHETTPIERYGTNAAFGFSEATSVGDLVFVSGQVAVDDEGTPCGIGDVGAQAEIVFERLGKVLEASGSGFDHVTKITVFTTDRSHIPTIRAIRRRVFEAAANFPASTFAVVVALAEPEYLVEIEAVATRSSR